MNLIAKRIRGMQDLLPEDSYEWETVERVMKEEAEVYGFKLIRTPVLESTELFERSAGETSDVVDKEMYTFLDKGGRSLSLRPEGTAGVVRAFLENGLHNGVLPLKVMYMASCYRYEKPQNGRYREFHQFGLEVFGGNSALADAELICLAESILERLGIKDVSLEINVIGCPPCRERYNEEVRSYFESHKSELCNTCKERLERNPLRIFDCKNSKCIKLCKDAPVSVGYICRDCAEHFEKLKYYLHAANIKYSVNPHIVRGLDYYTKTVFEFVSNVDGQPITICGGGRYDELTKQVGGPKMSAIGLGFGVERLLTIMKKQGIEFDKRKRCEVYIAPMGDSAKIEAVKIIENLRKSSILAEMDIVGRNIKAQMKYADKIGAKYCIIIGSHEMQEKKAKLKNMETGVEVEINLGDDFMDDFMKIYLHAESKKGLFI